VPIARYFIFVGGTLAALLLIAGWRLPTPQAMFAKQVCAQMAGKGRPGHQPADHNTSGHRGASGDAVGLATA